jgi:hypothetical protein
MAYSYYIDFYIRNTRAAIFSHCRLVLFIASPIVYRICILQQNRTINNEQLPAYGFSFKFLKRVFVYFYQPVAVKFPRHSARLYHLVGEFFHLVYIYIKVVKVVF